MRTRVTEALGIDVPIVQAPMAGSSGVPLAVEVARAGGLGSLPTATLRPDAIRSELAAMRALVTAPFNINFFCHVAPEHDDEGDAQWQSRLAKYYDEFGIEQTAKAGGSSRATFDSSTCELLEELRPEVVSFHFGLPAPALLERVRAAGATILSSATTVDEARWLEDHGCDIVIAQGAEAGGHRAMFLTSHVPAQIGTMALVPQVVDAVSAPVIAAGGIADARGIAAALVLGAEGVQIGTGFLLCPEASTAELHRRALEDHTLTETVLTNVFTGRPARALVNRAVRELGPMSDRVPPFPLAAIAMTPLRAAAEQHGSSDFTPLWSGQAGPLARPRPAGELVRGWITETEEILRSRATRLEA